jgi:hypothetical protein
MKYLFVAMAGLQICLAAAAQDETKNDTVVVEGPQKVVIATTGNAQTVEVVGKTGNPAYRYRKTVGYGPDAITQVQQNGGWDFKLPFVSKSNSCTVQTDSMRRPVRESGFFTGNFCIGELLAPGKPKSMNLSNPMSLEMSFDLIGYQHYLGRCSSVSVALGYDCRFYRLTDRAFVRQDGKMTIGDIAGAKDIRQSVLRIYSASIPVMYHYSPGGPSDRSEIGLGAIFNVNCYSDVETRYLDADDHKRKLTLHGAHQVPFSVDFKVQVNSFRGFGAYVKYSPFNVLKSDRGPKFQSFSLGFIL